MPDTNALIANPDLATYSRAVGDASFEVVLLPAVFSELDKLKDRGGKDVARKAQAFIRRVKGLRDKGRLPDGVALTRSITVRAQSREVDPSDVLEWLDPTVMDDRILGAALRFQAEHPHGRVVLVTSDLNLQNKADAVGLPYEQTPPTDGELSARIVPEIERRGRERHWVLALRNEGPKQAKAVSAKVTTSQGARPVITAGPFDIGDLRKGDVLERQLLLIASGDAYVNVEWEDGVGRQTKVWHFQLDADAETVILVG